MARERKFERTWLAVTVVSIISTWAAGVGHKMLSTLCSSTAESLTCEPFASIRMEVGTQSLERLSWSPDFVEDLTSPLHPLCAGPRHLTLQQVGDATQELLTNHEVYRGQRPRDLFPGGEVFPDIGEPSVHNLFRMENMDGEVIGLKWRPRITPVSRGEWQGYDVYRRRAELDTILPPWLLTGKSFFEAAALDGNRCFHAEAAGANYVHCSDYQGYGGRERDLETDIAIKLWQAESFMDGSPGRQFGLHGELARLSACLRKSRIRWSRVNVYDLSPRLLAENVAADVVFAGGLLYHLKHPVLAAEVLASVTHGVLILETAELPMKLQVEGRSLCKFAQGAEENHDPTNYFFCSSEAITALFLHVGFAQVFRFDLRPLFGRGVFVALRHGLPEPANRIIHDIIGADRTLGPSQYARILRIVLEAWPLHPSQQAGEPPSAGMLRVHDFPNRLTSLAPHLLCASAFRSSPEIAHPLWNLTVAEVARSVASALHNETRPLDIFPGGPIFVSSAGSDEDETASELPTGRLSIVRNVYEVPIGVRWRPAEVPGMALREASLTRILPQELLRRRTFLGLSGTGNACLWAEASGAERVACIPAAENFEVFALSRCLRRSHIEAYQGEVYDLLASPSQLGQFDVVFAEGLHEWNHTLLALQGLASVTAGVLILDMELLQGGNVALCSFAADMSHGARGGALWHCNLQMLAWVLRDLGFEQIADTASVAAEPAVGQAGQSVQRTFVIAARRHYALHPVGA